MRHGNCHERRDANKIRRTNLERMTRTTEPSSCAGAWISSARLAEKKPITHTGAGWVDGGGGGVGDTTMGSALWGAQPRYH